MHHSVIVGGVHNKRKVSAYRPSIRYLLERIRYRSRYTACSPSDLGNGPPADIVNIYEHVSYN